jgi:Right handed beta helix region
MNIRISRAIVWLLALGLVGFLVPALAREVPFARSQFPELASLPDETAEFQSILNKNGSLLLPPGVHRITRTLEITLGQSRSVSIMAESGPATLIMDGPGPAIRIVGSHEGSAAPSSFAPATWNERMPLIEGIEIVGNHPEADGIELSHCVQPTLNRVAIRWCRHAVHLIERNRNVIISDCHFYENRGIGLFLDDVNLHQINVANSHISYNQAGGVVVIGGNVRNLQITGCDIEANMPETDRPTTAANILLDISGFAEDKNRSIAEVAITGCTIQHSSNYSGKDFTQLAPGGANVRLLGNTNCPIDSVTISGNIIGDASLCFDLSHAADLTLTGNTLMAPNPDFLLFRDSARFVIQGNTFHPREFARPGRLVFERCTDSVVSNNILRKLEAPDGVVVLQDCSGIALATNVLAQCSSGIRIVSSHRISLRDWVISDFPKESLLLETSEDSTSVVASGMDKPSP